MPNDNRNDRQLPARVEPSQLGLPDEPVDDLAKIRHALENAQRQANVLAPLTPLDYIPPDHVVSFKVVLFDSHEGWDNKSNGTWYQTDGGKLALHRSSLDKLAQAAEISTIDSRVQVMAPFVWRCAVTVRMKGMDGQMRTIIRSKVIDLSDGSPEARKCGGDRALLNARSHGAQLCESKAANRAVRAILGLKGAYTKAEAERPFVFPKLTWVPDMNDPEIRRMVAARELGLIGEIYGPGSNTPAYAPAGNVIEADHQLSASELDAAEAGDYDDRDRNQDRRRDDRDDRNDRRQPDHRDESRERRPLPLPMGETCSRCDAEVPERVAEYSRRQFGAVLCRNCQQAPRR